MDGQDYAKVALISTFEGGFQPVSLATSAGILKENHIDFTVLDTYVDGFDPDKFHTQEFVGISVPLFDSLMSGISAARKIRAVNKKAHICFFGQYAMLNMKRLVPDEADSCIYGEWEEQLPALINFLGDSGINGSDPLPDNLKSVYICGRSAPAKGYFPVRRKNIRILRDNLPPLHKYPQQQIDKLVGRKTVSGATEIVRGCHHKCLYCSVYAAYDGRSIPFKSDHVFEDVKNLVNFGMNHLTFLDADFFSLGKYGGSILKNLNKLYPDLTFDFTTRVDHILENAEFFKELANCNLSFVTTALEFPGEQVLNAVGKNISIDQIETAIRLLRSLNIEINPTFIMFNPWMKMSDVIHFKKFVDRNNLEKTIDPIQYETRLHLYKSSPLLKSPALKGIELEEKEFHYEWKHPDPAVDELYKKSVKPVKEGEFKRCCLKC